jgi:hypothetical protein
LARNAKKEDEKVGVKSSEDAGRVPRIQYMLILPSILYQFSRGENCGSSLMEAVK